MSVNNGKCCRIQLFCYVTLSNCQFEAWTVLMIIWMSRSDWKSNNLTYHIVREDKVIENVGAKLRRSNYQTGCFRKFWVNLNNLTRDWGIHITGCFHTFNISEAAALGHWCTGFWQLHKHQFPKMVLKQKASSSHSICYLSDNCDTGEIVLPNFVHQIISEFHLFKICAYNVYSYIIWWPFFLPQMTRLRFRLDGEKKIQIQM